MKYTLTATILALAAFSATAQLSFTGNTLPAITVKPDANTGLEAIYVLDGTQGVTATWKGSAGVEWMAFDGRGGGYASPLTSTVNGGNSAITLGADDTGIIVNDNGRQHCYWIVNYASQPMHVESMQVNEAESDCSITALDVQGSAPRITYYTVNGAPRDLSRDITVSYSTLVADGDNGFVHKDETATWGWLSPTLRVAAPLADTQFTLSGDRFLTQWGRGIEVSTPTIRATAVNAMTTAVTTPRDVDNEMSSEGAGGALGGSAPVEIKFEAKVTDAVAFYEWQMSPSAEFDPIDLRFNDLTVTHTFRDFGTTYVRFVAADASGVCEYTGETYRVDIGESLLECPNAFSPGGSPGVNDEWKVSYKSIVSFECHIFNRWGVELFSTDNPAQGWDGRYKGKLVPTGVYFYAIKARGADGKNYSLAGDINIIGHQRGSTTQTPTE